MKFISLRLAIALLLASGAQYALAQTTQHDVRCTLAGPDSLFFDKVQYNRYLPSEFAVDVTVSNAGTTNVDSVYVFPRSNQRFTVVSPSNVLLTPRLAAGETLPVSFTLRVNPRQVSGFDTLIVAVSGKEGARTECSLVIWVEKEYRPVNVLSCPDAGSIHTAFIDTLNAYEPNPLTFSLRVDNVGDAPSKETRILYVATPSLSLADGQPQSIDLGTLGSGESVSWMFRLNVVPRSNDTTVTVTFRVQGKGGIGDKIIDTLCQYDLFIPAVREVLFDLECENDPAIRFEDGKYVPNPFPWTVRIRNTGNSKAKNVRASISHSTAFILESGQNEQVIGDLLPGEVTQVQWMVRALSVPASDTSAVCVRVFDQFNRSASCCDTVILPGVRAPLLESECLVLPDSIRVNPSTGLYQPAEFTVDLLVRNLGTDPADSVYAEIIIADPDIRLVNPAVSRQLVDLSLSAGAQRSVSWTIAPLPVQQPRDLTILLRVLSRNHATISTTCAVHIDAALQPAFDCAASTQPADTLHYSIATLEYDALRFTATLKNIGTIAARNVEATILLPSGMSLPSTEQALYLRRDPLPVDSTWSVTWLITPEKRRNGTLDTIRVEFRSGSLRSYCERWIFIVGIPPVTVFTIPRNIVDRYDKEITVPILIDEAFNKDIVDVDLHVRYDARLLDFLRLETDSTVLRNWSIVGSNPVGRVQFRATSPDGTALQGSGELIRMRFRVRFGDGADILNTAVSMLEFDSLASSVNRGSVLARYYDGFVTVSGDCLWPLKATEKYIILDSHPNPFNPSTTFVLHLPAPGEVALHVYDLSGALRVMLPLGVLLEGEHRMLFDGSTLPSGSYRALLMFNGRVAASHRIILLR